VSLPRTTLAEARAAAVDELFVALDAVIHSYRSLPAGERDDRLSDDAALITGEIARRLAVARARISAAPVPLSRVS